MKESAIWSAGYIGVAVLFGVVMFVFGGADAGSEYFAGYLTEQALSVDNLFVFLVIMDGFRVPPVDQRKVLLFGIVMALIARTGFIFLGAALITTFSWAFYAPGLILLLTAAGMLRSASGEETAAADKALIRLASKVVRAPMLLVMTAIAGTDLIFALDSLPAIFGLTRDTYTVFTATAFALLGLRQLYFLVDGLPDRLVYLSTGLFVILAFIGAKLILHAMHEGGAGGIEIGTGPSLLVIVGVLTVTVIASLGHRRDATQSETKRDRELVLRR